LAEHGVAAGPVQGAPAGASKVVDMSSISPIETKAFAQQDPRPRADYLDAPVSGGEVGAKNATLSIMVGGRRGHLRARQAAVRG
jgi:2-hydroxy-3-oxopropionate reductase